MSKILGTGISISESAKTKIPRIGIGTGPYFGTGTTLVVKLKKFYEAGSDFYRLCL